GVPAPATDPLKTRAQTLLTHLTEAVPDILSSEEVVRALVVGYSFACLLAADPDDPAQSQAQAHGASFQRALDVQHQAMAGMLRRLSKALPPQGWDVRSLFESEAEAWATLLCCLSDAVPDATAELLLAITNLVIGAHGSLGTPVVDLTHASRSKLRALLETVRTDGELLGTLLHGLGEHLSRLLKMDATAAYHLLARYARSSCLAVFSRAVDKPP